MISVAEYRAKVNCKRCYGLLDFLSSIGRDSREEILENDQVYAAGNEAMKALESCFESQSSALQTAAKTALKACYGCEYKRPSIIDVLEGKLFREIADYKPKEEAK